MIDTFIAVFDSNFINQESVTIQKEGHEVVLALQKTKL